MRKIIATTSNTIEGGKIIAYYDIVNANIVVGNNVFSEMFASFTDFFGGRSGKYQNKLDELYKYAMRELREKAEERGANAIIGVKMDFGEITGKGKDMFMLSAVGTAVKIDYLTPELRGEVEVMTEKEKEFEERRKVEIAEQKAKEEAEKEAERNKPKVVEIGDENALLGEVMKVIETDSRRAAIQYLRSKGMDFTQAVMYMSNNFPEE